MAVAFKLLTFDFDRTKGEVQELHQIAQFGRRIRPGAQAALQTFNVRYSDTDHELKQFMIDIFVTDVNENVGNVTVHVKYLLRDASGDIDDPFQGVIRALVIADTV